LASRAVQRGHVCAHLDRMANEPLLDGDGMAVVSALELDLTARLARLSSSPPVSDGSVPAPLVLQASRLYLYRYFDYERRLAAALRQRSTAVNHADEVLLEQGLTRLFPDASEQRDAAATAVRRRLAIISGGPGTGK